MNYGVAYFPLEWSIDHGEFLKISSLERGTNLSGCYWSQFRSCSHHPWAGWKLQCLRYGFYQSSSPNSSKLSDCESQYLRSAADSFYSFGLNWRPHKTPMDFYRVVLPREWLLHTNISRGLLDVCDNYQREQVFPNCSPARQCCIFQQAKNSRHGFHIMVLCCLHRYPSNHRLGPLRVLFISRDLFHRSRQQLFVHDFPCVGLHCYAILCRYMVLPQDLLRHEKKWEAGGTACETFSCGDKYRKVKEGSKYI